MLHCISNSDNLRHGQVGRDPATGRFISLDIGRAVTCDDEGMEALGTYVTDISPGHANSAFMFLHTESTTERFGRLFNGDRAELTTDQVYECCSDPEQAAILCEEIRQAELDAAEEWDSYSVRPHKSAQQIAEERYWEAVLAENASRAKRAAARAKRLRQDAKAREEFGLTKAQRRRANQKARKAAMASAPAYRSTSTSTLRKGEA